MLLQRLEALPVGSFHYKLLFITGLGWLFDAMDTGLIGFVLPVLGKEWGLAATQMGAIGSIGLVGMALGAVVAGSIADRFGRKTVFSSARQIYRSFGKLLGRRLDLRSLHCLYVHSSLRLALCVHHRCTAGNLRIFHPPAHAGISALSFIKR